MTNTMSVVLTLIIGFVGGIIGTKLKVPAGALIGSMIFVAIYNIFTNNAFIPKNFKVTSQILVGSIIGISFTLSSVMELRKMLVPALMLVISLTVFSLLLGFVISKFTNIDLVTALFGSLPGGLTDMAIISEIYGADTPKVVSMHLSRMLTVVTIVPILIRLIANYFK